MELTETIERTFADVAETIESTFGALAERTPTPADKLLNQLGTFNVEAIRQCGRATVRSMAAIEDIVRTLEDRAQGVAGKADAAVDRARDEAKDAAATARKAATKARSSAEKTASKAKDAVEDTVDDLTEAGVRAVVANENLKAKSKADLYELAQVADVDGRSNMTKAQLITALKKV